MSISPITSYSINTLGLGVQMPNSQRNYCLMPNQKRIERIVAEGENSVKEIEKFLKSATTEQQIVEGLFVVDRMIEANISGAKNLYPTISKFNDTKSPNIQVMLAGIYRKTLVPDAFGPLNKMLYNQIVSPNSPYFDATEEIGGAILEYLRTKGAQQKYNEREQTHVNINELVEKEGFYGMCK